MKKIDWKDILTKKILMMIYDILVVNLSYVLTQFIIFGDLTKLDLQIFSQRALPITVIFVLLFYTFRIYSSMWEYAGIKELVNVVFSTGIAGLSTLAVDMIMAKLGFAAKELPNNCFSTSFYVFGTMVAIVFVGGMRLAYRAVRRHTRTRQLKKADKLDRVMIVGAGDMGMIIISELEANNYQKGKPVVAVDDNYVKIGKRLRGVPIKGSCDQIPELAKSYKIDKISIVWHNEKEITGARNLI